MARCNKCGTGFYPGSAARAALDLKSAKKIQTCACKPPCGHQPGTSSFTALCEADRVMATRC